MFERESLSLAEEGDRSVRSYLEVMQARLGERLRWVLEIEPGPGWTVPVPPGLLLTLAENAIGHGIEPALRGGRVVVRAWRQDQQVDAGGGGRWHGPEQRSSRSSAWVSAIPAIACVSCMASRRSLSLLPRSHRARSRRCRFPWTAAAAECPVA